MHLRGRVRSCSIVNPPVSLDGRAFTYANTPSCPIPQLYQIKFCSGGLFGSVQFCHWPRKGRKRPANNFVSPHNSLEGGPMGPKHCMKKPVAQF